MSTAAAERGPTTIVDGRPHLVGSRCGSCGSHTFPPQGSCPRCSEEMSEVALPAEGTLWSWTRQHVRPKPPYQGPEEFEPFAVGYVDLGPVRIESRIEGGPAGTSWRIGEPMRLVLTDAGPVGTEPSFWFERAER